MRRSTLLKLADHVLNIVEKVIEKLIRQKVDIKECSLVLCLEMKLLTPF